MAEQAVLEERIEHLQKDVTEIRQDVRRLDGRVDEVQKTMAAMETRLTAAIGSVETKLTAAIGSVEARLTVMLVSLIKWVIGTMLAGIGVASAIAFGVAKVMK